MGWVKVAAAAVSIMAVTLLTAPGAWAAGDANYGDRAGNYVLHNLHSPWYAALALSALVFLLPGARKAAVVGTWIAVVLLTGAAVFHGQTIGKMIGSILGQIQG